MTIIDPNLTAGWERETPLTDSLLRQFLVNWATTDDVHGAPLDGRILRRDHLAAVDVGRPLDFVNVATLLAPLSCEGVEEVTTALDDFYGFSTGKGTGRVHLFSPWPTPDLRLRCWTLLDYLPLLLRPAGGRSRPDPSSLRIETVRDDRALRGFEQAMVRGFLEVDGDNLEAGTAFHPERLRDERVHMWVGWERDRPVAAASTFVDAGIYHVALVATAPGARRRGYGAALTSRAMLAEPKLPSLLLATDDGRPVYERLGFAALIRFTLWTRDRPGTKPSSWRVTADTREIALERTGGNR